MCELLAIAFNKPVTPNLSLRGFQHRSQKNPHGWGLAYYQDNAAQIFKEPLRAKDSALAHFLRDYAMESPIFLGHVRRASAGSHTLRNCHPFVREVQGIEITGMHNGTLRRNYRQALPLGRYRPLGETDSEHAFCHILQALEDAQLSLKNPHAWPWLAEKCARINDYGDFNLILSDGERVFCYHDIRGYNGLYYVYREAPYEEVCLRDEDWVADFAVQKDQEQRGFVVASQPLTDEVWTRFEAGELIVIRQGSMIYSNMRDPDEMARQRLLRIEDQVLCALRAAPHSVTLSELLTATLAGADETWKAVQGLVRQRYIRQDRRDTVPADDPQAHYYTLRGRREMIDRRLGSD